MAQVENWPVVKSENITVGSPENNIAIATLWTRREILFDSLDSANYCIIGQLYSKYGASLLLRNIASNPNIRHLILCGTELASGSGENLIQLWKNGINSDHEVIGIDKSSIQKEIPNDAVNIVRSNVLLHDLRSLRPNEMVKGVRDYIEVLPSLPFWGEPLVFPPSPALKAEHYPSESGAHVIRGKTVAETWLKILREIIKYGEDAPTNYGTNGRDLSDLIAVVTDEDPKNPTIKPYLVFNREELDAYAKEFLEANCPEDIFYTYGERIHAYESKTSKINQVEIMLKKLREDPNDRGAIAVLYDPYKDNQLDREVVLDKGFRTPCIVFIQASVKNKALELSAYFRSNDMFGAWPRNAFGLRFLQGVLADNLGYPLGHLRTISNRAHIYEDVVPQVMSILQKNSQRYEFEEDPRGNFRILTDSNSGKIKVTHQDRDGVPLSEAEWEGKRKKASVGLGNKLVSEGGFSSYSHAMDIGRELLKAEIAIKLGLDYRQDSDDMIEYLEKLISKAREHNIF